MDTVRDVHDIRRRHIKAMQDSVKTIGHIVHMTSAEDARTYHDGGDGWTALEVLCHLRDYDRIFHQRAAMMRDGNTPELPGYDHNSLVVENAYNVQDWQAVYKELVESRLAFVAFFEALTSKQWDHDGIHHERGLFSMTDALIQVTLHDVNHMEQMTRLLVEKQT